MNKWFRRAVGTVGVAGGMLLLGAGTAHADDTALTPGQLDDLFSPTGGPNNVGLSLDSPGTRLTMGLVPDGPVATKKNTGEVGAVVHTPGENGQPRDIFLGGRMPDLLSTLPLGSIVPTDALGLPKTTSSALPKAVNRVLPTNQVSGTESAGLPALPGTDEAGLPALPLAGSLLPGLGNGPSVDNANSATVTRAVPVNRGDVVHVLPPGPDQPTGSDQMVEDPLSAFGGEGGNGGLPLLDGQLPLLGGGGLPALASLPVKGNFVPAGDMTIPVGQDESTHGGLPVLGDLPVVGDLPVGGGGLPLVGDLPVGGGGLPLVGELPVVGDLPIGGDVAQGNQLRGLPLIGETTQPDDLPVDGLPTSGLPTSGLPIGGLPTGGLPIGGLPVVGELMYTPRHASTYHPRHSADERPVAASEAAAESTVARPEALPLVGGLGQGGLPVVGNLGGLAGSLPVVGNILRGGGLPG